MRLFFFLILFVSTRLLTAESGDEKTFKVVRADEFQELLLAEDNELLVDARTNIEYRKHKIPGAIHAPQRSMLFPLLDSLDKDQAIFVYCGRGIKSGMVCKLILDKGFTRVYNLKGGFKSWVKQDLPLEKIK